MVLTSPKRLTEPDHEYSRQEKEAHWLLQPRVAGWAAHLVGGAAIPSDGGPLHCAQADCGMFQTKEYFTGAMAGRQFSGTPSCVAITWLWISASASTRPGPAEVGVNDVRSK
jgi:hypothetical protein